MKKYGSALYFSFVLIAIFCFAGYGFAQEASDQEGYGNDQEAPNGEVGCPPCICTSPPDVVAVPSEQYPDQDVYMVPNMAGVYVNQGVWYRNYGGIWYSSPAYNGVWSAIDIAIVPPIILSVPLEYPLYLPRDYYRIHYDEYHSHWREWERDRHWHNQDWYRHEMRSDIRRDR